MEREKNVGFHSFIRGIILIGLAMFLIKLVMTGAMVSYISTTMLPIIYVTIVALLLFGMMLVWNSGGKKEAGQQQFEGKSRFVILYGTFIATIIAGLMLSNIALNENNVQNNSDFIKELEQMYGIEEDLPSDLHLEEE